MSRLSRLVYLLVLFTGGCAQHSITAADENTVDLRLFSPLAKKVYLHSSENHFLPQRAHRESIVYWSVTVHFQEQFSYFFTVDDTVVIPACAYREQDDYGRFNCIYPRSL